ncbi:perlucin [Patella vulgata]|uniref:perlucin n=1 Tax=Patella vulgata TaxID=6465 RepID=UPI0024A81D5C|nr:perlucin [Patella vulgata]
MTVHKTHGQQCPNGYHQHEQSCYAIVTFIANWNDAETMCQAAGSHLASVETDAERLYLNQYINFLHGSKYRYYWIGSFDFIDGTYMWVGTQNTLGQIPWYPGEPSKRPGEHCLMMVQDNHSLFGDFECNTEQAFVCEVGLNSPVVGQ